MPIVAENDNIQKIVNNYDVTIEEEADVEANPSNPGSTALNAIRIGEAKYVIPTYSQVTANPSYSGSNTLSTVEIDSTKYKIGGGTTVIANPTYSGSNTLNTVQIADTMYKIEGGGGGAAVRTGDSTTLPFRSLQIHTTNLYNASQQSYAYPGGITFSGIQASFFTDYTPHGQSSSSYPCTLPTLEQIVGRLYGDYFAFAAIYIPVGNNSYAFPLYFQVTDGGSGSGSGSGSGDDNYTFSLYGYSDSGEYLIAEEFYSVSKDDLSTTTISDLMSALANEDLDKSLTYQIIEELHLFIDYHEDDIPMTTPVYILCGYNRVSPAWVNYLARWESLFYDDNIDSELNFCTFNQFFEGFLGVAGIDFMMLGTYDGYIPQ